DLRGLIHRLEQDLNEGRKLFVDLVHPHAAAGSNPREVLEKVLGLSEAQAQEVRIIKVNSREHNI
ncbi:MAG: hypothetical protein D3924_20885, partial [Candidatus Electrothrix sp. AR4]|nr:hypothetical protein [Candidatus Electrothrix sp. AR4]